MVCTRRNYPWTISTLFAKTKWSFRVVRSNLNRYGKGFNHWRGDKWYILARSYIGNDLPQEHQVNHCSQRPSSISKTLQHPIESHTLSSPRIYNLRLYSQKRIRSKKREICPASNERYTGRIWWAYHLSNIYRRTKSRYQGQKPINL